MNPIKTLFERFLPPSEVAPRPDAPSPDATAATGESAATQPPRQKYAPIPSVIAIPDEIREQLFPVHDVMVSAIFGETNRAGALLPAGAETTPELPQSE